MDIQISCGDFLKFESRESYDFVYDRASLVALPPRMRADCIDSQTPKLEGARLASLGDAVKQEVYILEKR